MQNTSQPLLSGFVPILILVLCEIVLSVVMMKKAKFRRFICGKPQIVINDGKIDQAQMKRLRISTEDLCEQLRQLDCFNIEDIAYAIVETNGKMSILRKPEKDTPTLSDLKIKKQDKGIEAVVISDGERSDYSMKLCGVDNAWLSKTLEQNKVEQQNVFLMTANKKKEYQIILKEKKK